MSDNTSASIIVTADDVNRAHHRTVLTMGAINGLRNLAILFERKHGLPSLTSDLSYLYCQVEGTELEARDAAIWQALPRYLCGGQPPIQHATIDAATGHQFVFRLAAQTLRAMTVGAAEAIGLDAGGDSACTAWGWLSDNFDAFERAGKLDSEPTGFRESLCRRLNGLPKYDFSWVLSLLEVEHYRALDRVPFSVPLLSNPAATDNQQPMAEVILANPTSALPLTPTPEYCLVPPSSIRWATTKEVAPRLYRLFNFALTKSKNSIHFDTLRSEVFENDNMTDHSVSNAIGELNNAIDSINFPWLLSTKLNHLVIDFGG